MENSNLREVLAGSRRYLHWVLACGLAAGSASSAFFWFFGSYTAEATFVAEDSPLGAAGLAGIASQLGVNLPFSASGRPVDYYVAILKSPQLLTEMARSRYELEPLRGGDTRSGTLFALYGFDEDTSGRAVEDMLERLDSRVSVSANRRSGVVAVRVKAPWPGVAQQMTRRLLELVNEFNRRSLQSRAGAEREFVGQRLDSARRELREAEGAVERFLADNRSYTNSPRLMFQFSRLQREMDTRQEVYATLTRAYEQARIEEVRNTPVISVLQRPELYWRRSRSPLLMGLLAFVVFSAVALVALLGLERVAATENGVPTVNALARIISRRLVAR